MDIASVAGPSSPVAGAGGVTVGRRLTPLTPQGVDHLSDPCRRCAFWELGTRAKLRGSDAAGWQKEAWLSSIALEWGAAGHLLSVDGVPAAYSLYGPVHFFDHVADEAAKPVSRDAVLLGTLSVRPAFEGQGLGRVLLQAMAKDLTRRKVPAAEAFADRAWTGRACHLPAAFLESCGFQVLREHPRFPLMRMDLRAAVRWKAVSEALNALRVPVPALRPSPSPTSSPERDGAARRW